MLIFSVLAKILAGKSVSDMTYLVSTGTVNLNSINFLSSMPCVSEVTSSASATIQVSSRQYMANQPLNTTRPHTTTQSTVSRRSDPYNYSGTSGSQASFRPPSVALSTTVNSFQMLGSALVSTGSDRHGSSDAVAAGLAYLRGSVQQPALQPTQTFGWYSFSRHRN